MVPLLLTAFQAADRLSPYEQTLLAERILLELYVEPAAPCELSPLPRASGSAEGRGGNTPDTRPR